MAGIGFYNDLKLQHAKNINLSVTPTWAKPDPTTVNARDYSFGSSQQAEVDLAQYSAHMARASSMPKHSGRLKATFGLSINADVGGSAGFNVNTPQVTLAKQRVPSEITQRALRLAGLAPN